MTGTVRRLGPADADAYVELRREALEGAPLAFGASPETDVGLDAAFLEKSFAEPGQATFGAFDPDLMGTVTIVRGPHRKSAHRAHVYAMWVSPEHRGRGWGRALMEAVLAFAAEEDGITQVQLEVSSTATEARALYEGLGFVTWGVEPNSVRVGDRSVAQHHMVLVLPAG